MNKKLSVIKRSQVKHWVGDGFYISNIFSYDDGSENLSPFILMDYIAPMTFSPTSQKRGIGPHPHRGFETVTLVYSGSIAHRDSHGGGGHIGTGDVQWMTAGAGILHEEYHSPEFTAQGGVLEAIQLWVNLPTAVKNTGPDYQSILSSNIPQIVLPEEAGIARVIAGELSGITGPAKTHTRINVFDIQFNENKTLHFDIHEGDNVALFVISGSVIVDELHAIAQDLVVFAGVGNTISFTTGEAGKILLLSGEPINEPMVGRGPFVMNSEEEVNQAFRDYRKGVFGKMPSWHHVVQYH